MYTQDISIQSSDIQHGVWPLWRQLVCVVHSLGHEASHKSSLKIVRWQAHKHASLHLNPLDTLEFDPSRGLLSEKKRKAAAAMNTCHQDEGRVQVTSQEIAPREREREREREAKTKSVWWDHHHSLGEKRLDACKPNQSQNYNLRMTGYNIRKCLLAKLCVCVPIVLEEEDNALEFFATRSQSIYITINEDDRWCMLCCEQERPYNNKPQNIIYTLVVCGL